MKKDIAIFDLSITTDSPAGSCILQLIKNLSESYHFIVFSDRFENPDPENISWIRVPLPDKPVIARYILFKYSAPAYYKKFIRDHRKPDLIISTEGEFSDCDICYVHFCHRAYLEEQHLDISSIRGLVRFANHHFNARTEKIAIAQASKVVVPSLGLAHQLAGTYPAIIESEIKAIPNPVDVEHFTRPEGYDGELLRHELGFSSTDIVIVFVALGSFGRKGLAFIIRALALLKTSQLKLLVVGGNSSEIDEYTSTCNQLKVGNKVNFVGLQSDVRPYLWISNLFILPSSYETFSLVTFQAAIAGLPLMVTELYGVSELLKPGVNGWLVERNEFEIAQALKSAIQNQSNLPNMGARAKETAAKYGISKFVEQWQELLNKML